MSTAGRFRTIMAYGNQCTDAGFNCQRINQFSSPNYQLNNIVIGNATTADAGRMLNLTRTTVANTFVLLSVSPFLAAIARRLVLREAVPTRTWLAMSVSLIRPLSP